MRKKEEGGGGISFPPSSRLLHFVVVLRTVGAVGTSLKLKQLLLLM